MRPTTVALLAPSPVHYQVPIYRRLEADPRVEFTAIFCSDAGVRPADFGYAEAIAWGGELLEGYRSEFLGGARDTDAIGGFWSLRDMDAVSRLRRGRFDCLWMHGYNYATHQVAAAVQRLQRGALLVREEQTLIHPRGLAKTIVKEAALRAVFRGAYGLYIGTESRRWFEHYGVPPERLSFVPYCVDNGALRSAAARLRPQRGSLRESFGVDADGGPVVLVVSRLVPGKQVGRVLEAFRRVRDRERCTLLVVGAGSEEAELRAAARERGIPDVVFAGFLDQTEIWRAYACADVFALFSAWHETWGIVVNEAANFELPLLVSDRVGSGRDLVSAGRNGWVIGFDDQRTLTERLATLVGDEGLRRRMGEQSAEIVSGWSPEVAAEGVISAATAAVGRDAVEGMVRDAG